MNRHPMPCMNDECTNDQLPCMNGRRTNDHALQKDGHILRTDDQSQHSHASHKDGQRGQSQYDQSQDTDSLHGHALHKDGQHGQSQYDQSQHGQSQCDQSQCTDSQSFHDTFVHTFYTTHAHTFSHTRHKPWPSVAHFLNEQDGLVLDAGSGNGRHLHSRCIAVDMSYDLLHIHRTSTDSDAQPLAYVNADIHSLPFTAHAFDAVLCCAVIHHMVDPSTALKECLRVLKRDGTCMVVVWGVHALGNRKRQFTRIDIRRHTSTRTPAILTSNDYLIGWRDSTSLRYYHLYEKDELIRLVQHVGFKVLTCNEENESINIKMTY